MKELNIAKTDDVTFRPEKKCPADSVEMTSELKSLIQKMTFAKPEDQLSASDTLNILHSLNTVTADTIKKPCPQDDKQVALKGQLRVNNMYLLLSSYLISIQKSFQRILRRLFT